MSAQHQMMIRHSVAVFVILNSVLLDYLFSSCLKVFLKSLFPICSFTYHSIMYVETNCGQITPLNMKKRNMVQQ